MLRFVNAVFKLILVLLLTTWLGVNAVSAKESVDWKALEQEVRDLRVANNIPGLAVGVIKDSELSWSVGLGYADSNRTVPVTTDTPFWIASLTKTFVGLAYLHLEAQGKVNLDELAADTPNFSGLCEWLASTTIPFAAGLDCTAKINIRHILHHQVNGIPGTQFMYNPIMYSRLSRHLEHKFGKGIDAVEGRHNYLGQTIDKHILKSAKMQRTMSSMWDRSKMEVYFDMADGFKVDDQGNKHKMRRPDKHIAGGAGVVSTIEDLAKYDIAISKGTIAPGKIKSKLLHTGAFDDGSPAPYGYGWYFQCYKGIKLMWHGGWDPEAGYSALHLRAPDYGLSIIALANSEGLWWGNSLTKPEVESSPIAKIFLEQLFELSESNDDSNNCALSMTAG